MGDWDWSLEERNLEEKRKKSFEWTCLPRKSKKGEAK